MENSRNIYWTHLIPYENGDILEDVKIAYEAIRASIETRKDNQEKIIALEKAWFEAQKWFWKRAENDNLNNKTLYLWSQL